MFLHWNACLLYMVVVVFSGGAETWVDHRNLTNKPFIHKYTWSLFKSASHMLCIGYGGDDPGTLAETWVTIFSMCTGASMFAGIIGAGACVVVFFLRACRHAHAPPPQPRLSLSVTAVLLTIDAPTNEFSATVSSTNAYMTYCKLPAPLKSRVRAYLLMRWAPISGRNGHAGRSPSGSFRKLPGEGGDGGGGGDESAPPDASIFVKFNEEAIMADLSPALRREIALYNCGKVLEQVPLFDSLMSPALITELARVLQVRVCYYYW